MRIIAKNLDAYQSVYLFAIRLVKFSARRLRVACGRPAFTDSLRLAYGTLFEANVPPLSPLAPRSDYAVSRDGKRFLIQTMVKESAEEPIAVVALGSGVISARWRASSITRELAGEGSALLP